nr:MAG TPA: hypothetical protein [Caudoviricetes sp.]
MLLNKFNMKRYKVGETFEYEGMILKTIEDDLKQEESGCKYCALNKFECSHIDCGTRMNPSVRFIEVSKEKLIADALPIIQDVMPLPPLEDKTNFIDDLDLKPKKKSLWDYLKLLWNKIK